MIRNISKEDLKTFVDGLLTLVCDVSWGKQLKSEWHDDTLWIKAVDRPWDVIDDDLNDIIGMVTDNTGLNCSMDTDRHEAMVMWHDQHKALDDGGDGENTYCVCWDCNLGGSFNVKANTPEEAEDRLREMIRAGEITVNDLSESESRVYEEHEVNN